MISEIQPGLLLAQHPVFADSMKNDIASMCTVLFNKNVPQKLDFEVCGHHQWDFGAIVMEFVDATVPRVAVHFRRAHFEIDKDAALISDFKGLLRRCFYHGCNRWRSVRKSPKCDSLPRLSVKVHLLGGHLETGFDILF